MNTPRFNKTNTRNVLIRRMAHLMQNGDTADNQERIRVAYGAVTELWIVAEQLGLDADNMRQEARNMRNLSALEMLHWEVSVGLRERPESWN